MPLVLCDVMHRGSVEDQRDGGGGGGGGGGEGGGGGLMDTVIVRTQPWRPWLNISSAGLA